VIAAWIRDPRHLRWLFLTTMLSLAAALAVLVWSFVNQDAQLSSQRAVAQQEASADLVVAELKQRLAAMDAGLETILRERKPPATIADGSVVVLIGPGQIEAWPRERLLYFPDRPEPDVVPAAAFEAAEELEYVRSDSAAAARALAVLAESSDVSIRAHALQGLARNQASAGRRADALATYERLRAQGGVLVTGLPATIAGALGALTIHERNKDATRAAEVARAIEADLKTARWPVSRSAFLTVEDITKAWIDSSRNGPDRILSEAISEFWSRPRQPDSRSGRTSLSAPVGESALVAWRTDGATTVATAIGSASIARDWLPAGGRVVLTDEGRVVGGVAGSGRAAVRLASTTSLPWTIETFATPGSDETAAMRTRHRLLLSGAGVLVALIVLGAWFVGHTMTREVAVARLQANFVAGVSHEFRTPLTSLCQMSELLARGRVVNDGDRETYYRLLNAESQRLRRLVENLLTFGRVDSGQMAFKSEPIELAPFIDATVSEFAAALPAAASRFRVEPGRPGLAVTGDRDALRTLLWNLIENAVKYSPDGGPVTVTVSEGSGTVSFAVTDTGMGIPPREQRRIFEKFVRGEGATERQIRGTGVGLALARAIARAHGGDIRVSSQPGLGSTFTVRLS
jgi:signal transduction histidine kinase